MLKQYYRINQATGVSITISPAGQIIVNACAVSTAQNKLHFEKKVTGLQNIEELNKHFPEKTFIALNLSGKGVLQRTIEKTEQINTNNFTKILPNAKLDDFYVQHFVSGDQSFVSVIRRAEADKWIEQMKNCGFIPLMLSLGPFPVQHIIPQLNVYGTEIVFDGHIIRLNGQAHWAACSYIAGTNAPFPIKVESESIDEHLLIAYATAFQLVLADQLELIAADVPPLQVAYRTQIEEKKFKANGFLILSAFFILLLINFLVFSWLNASNSKLTEQVSRTAQSTDDLQKINNQVQQKEVLLKNLGWEGNINKSALIDQVASLLPPEISWKEATIDPIDLSGSRSQKSITFFNRKIRLTGNSEKIIPVNEWIARIKTRPWVKNVQLDNYAFNSELNTGQFIIVIDY